jgi:hypothetical protein
MSTSINAIAKNGLNGQTLIAATNGIPIYANITSLDGSVVITNGTNSIDLSASGGGFVAPLVTAFTTPGTFTWTKSANVVRMELVIINGGGGGGSGQRGPTGTTAGGGGGSAGGALVYSGSPIYFGATETVIVGAGGTGGAAVTTNTTNGNNGTSGGISSLGKLSGPYNSSSQASFGSGGVSGTANPGGIFYGANYTRWGLFTSSTSNINVFPSNWQFQPGGFSSSGANGGTGGDVFQDYVVGTAGGGGGPSDSSVLYSGGAGGNIADNYDINILVAGGTAGIESGTINGGAGITGNYTSGGLVYGGTGGGGGGGQHSGGTAGTGGHGGAFGGGGGGGGASINGTNSGAGGNGGNGLVVIIEYYS